MLLLLIESTRTYISKESVCTVTDLLDFQSPPLQQSNDVGELHSCTYMREKNTSVQCMQNVKSILWGEKENKQGNNP